MAAMSTLTVHILIAICASSNFTVGGNEHVTTILPLLLWVGIIPLNIAVFDGS